MSSSKISQTKTYVARTALEVEEVVRSKGAVPATIGVVDGTIHIGLLISSSYISSNI